MNGLSKRKVVQSVTVTIKDCSQGSSQARKPCALRVTRQGSRREKKGKSFFVDWTFYSPLACYYSAVYYIIILLVIIIALANLVFVFFSG
jgi:hypothetical protein